MNIELIPEEPGKTTRVGTQLSPELTEEVIGFLRRNIDVFAWSAGDLLGVDPAQVTHHLNVDKTVRPVKQKKRPFGAEKDGIVQSEVTKLLEAGHIREVQFPEWAGHGKARGVWEDD
ncbi:hypothetical protein DH2020_038571 [Rehmannia glutinosa]|uniref:Uncharacterized protein n=1 Tax=Rehmannia glutinosa TaxID=99300 RepID=A0ABR0UYG1_REHGL